LHHFSFPSSFFHIQEQEHSWFLNMKGRKYTSFYNSKCLHIVRTVQNTSEYGDRLAVFWMLLVKNAATAKMCDTNNSMNICFMHKHFASASSKVVTEPGLTAPHLAHYQLSYCE
jgi:hypothetical protein